MTEKSIIDYAKAASGDARPQWERLQRPLRPATAADMAALRAEIAAEPKPYLFEPPADSNLDAAAFTAQAFALVFVIWPPFEIAADAVEGRVHKVVTRFHMSWQRSHPYELAALCEVGWLRRTPPSSSDRRRWNFGDDTTWFSPTDQGAAALAFMRGKEGARRQIDTITDRRGAHLVIALQKAAEEAADLGRFLGVSNDERWRKGPWA